MLFWKVDATQKWFFVRSRYYRDELTMWTSRSKGEKWNVDWTITQSAKISHVVASIIHLDLKSREYFAIPRNNFFLFSFFTVIKFKLTFFVRLFTLDHEQKRDIGCCALTRCIWVRMKVSLGPEEFRLICSVDCSPDVIHGTGNSAAAANKFAQKKTNDKSTTAEKNLFTLFARISSMDSAPPTLNHSRKVIHLSCTSNLSSREKLMEVWKVWTLFLPASLINFSKLFSFHVCQRRVSRESHEFLSLPLSFGNFNFT